MNANGSGETGHAGVAGDDPDDRERVDTLGSARLSTAGRDARAPARTAAPINGGGR
jgi:hypothetical protein